MYIYYVFYIIILSCCMPLYGGDSLPLPSPINPEQSNYEKLPDDVRDSLLLTHGINILTSVGKIFLDQALLDKQNPQQVEQNKQKIIFNLSFILESLGNFIYALVRRNLETPLHITKHEQLLIEQLTTMIYIHHLLQQHPLS